MGRKIVTLVVLFIFFVPYGSASDDILLNGTSFYLSPGDSYGLYQGYIITLKSVSSDGSAWVQLASNDILVKNEIVRIKNFFTYNKTNRTIVSLKIDTIYSGPNDNNLVSFFPVYQYMDRDMPEPIITKITPLETQIPENNSTLPQQKAVPETAIVVIGIVFILFMVYIIRKLW
jgi:hypothetical protein